MGFCCSKLEKDPRFDGVDGNSLHMQPVIVQPTRSTSQPNQRDGVTRNGSGLSKKKQTSVSEQVGETASEIAETTHVVSPRDIQMAIAEGL